MYKSIVYNCVKFPVKVNVDHITDIIASQYITSQYTKM